MPQLDFFTINAQFFCLIISLFFIYFFLLKYAMPAYDVFLRLKIKKLIYYRLQVENLIFLSLNFKINSNKYSTLVSTFISDFSKIYFNFLTSVFPMLYLVLINKNLINVSTEDSKILVVPLSHVMRVVVKDANILSKDLLTDYELSNLLGLENKKIT